jgi:hypothetical protein
MRKCCLDNPMARAAWWADVSQRWKTIRADIDPEIAAVILSHRKRFQLEMGVMIAPPTAEEKRHYRRMLRRNMSVHIPSSEGIVVDFKVLGLSWPFTEAQLKSAFRDRVIKAHPDHGGDDATFKALMDAYEAAKRKLGTQAA